jgi:hypothetical protein
MSSSQERIKREHETIRLLVRGSLHPHLSTAAAAGPGYCRTAKRSWSPQQAESASIIEHYCAQTVARLARDHAYEEGPPGEGWFRSVRSLLLMEVFGTYGQNAADFMSQLVPEYSAPHPAMGQITAYDTIQRMYGQQQQGGKQQMASKAEVETNNLRQEVERLGARLEQERMIARQALAIAGQRITDLMQQLKSAKSVARELDEQLAGFIGPGVEFEPEEGEADTGAGKS